MATLQVRVCTAGIELCLCFPRNWGRHILPSQGAEPSCSSCPGLCTADEPSWWRIKFSFVSVYALGSSSRSLGRHARGAAIRCQVWLLVACVTRVFTIHAYSCGTPRVPQSPTRGSSLQNQQGLMITHVFYACIEKHYDALKSSRLIPRPVCYTTFMFFGSCCCERWGTWICETCDAS